MKNQEIMGLVKSLSELSQVQAIALGGSHAMAMQDDLSDYDLYVYVSQRIPTKVRQEITSQYCAYMEISNQFWEEEDDGILNSGVEVEIIYRDLQWLESELSSVVCEYRASTGYTTCLWANLLHSKILYDPDHLLTQIKQRFSVDYPSGLKASILAKNKPLITTAMPAYVKQVRKALKRKDRVSVNHRVSEYLACYFDILFAINEVPHPGEKRLVAYSKNLCDRLPEQFEQSIEIILNKPCESDDSLVDELELASKNLIALSSHFNTRS